MDLVQSFLKDQFNDDDDYFVQETKPNPNREVQNLKKELEELKFYQELERTEYEDMKRKMHSAQNKKKRTTKLSQAITTDSGASNDIFDSLTDDDNANPELLAKLKRKEEEIEKLKKTLKTETSPKEFGKRMHKLEKSKNEEINEIKKHYKGLMEQLAKQIQKSNDRHDDEVKKNTALRSTMEEMRQDMASREQELEDKLLEMEAILKRSELKGQKIGQRLTSAEENLATAQVNLSENVAKMQEQKSTMRELEIDFEEERKEILENYEKEKDMAIAKFKEEVYNLKEDVDDITHKLNDTLEKLEIEERAHEDTVIQLKDTENSLKAVGEDVQRLEAEAQNAINEACLHRIQAEKEVQDAIKDQKRQLGECHEKLNIFQNHKLSLSTELKTTSAKLFAAEKKIELIGENTVQKQGAIRRKNIELEELQLELRELCDKHIKDGKAKDMQLAKDRKKWHATENVLRKELDEIKMSPTYLRLQVSKKPQISTATDAELRDLVEQLRAEKASLLLQLSAVKDRSTRDIGLLERKLKVAGAAQPGYTPPPKKEKPMFDYTKRSISFGTTTTSVAPAPASTQSSPDAYKKVASSSSMSVGSNASAELSVAGSKGIRQSLSTSAYRRQLRQRKLSKKVAE